ncbi:MAG TPA: nitrilase-related carbon-nitrogen hydrolase [Chloroflexia bacterium]|nr:nitrilase-related carbon-nitrogen hydrolase [Chloroflexia bacterium]
MTTPPGPPSPYTIGLAQINPTLGNVERNLAIHHAYIEQAATAGVDLLVFPEAGLTGYYLQDLTDEVAMRADAPPLLGLAEAAAAHNMDLCVGFIEEDSRYVHYISQAYFSAGALVHLHRKVYLPTYGMFDDMRFVGQGGQIRAFDTRFGRLGMLVCEDFWHISSPYLLWQDGADTLLLVSAGPGRGVKPGDDYLDTTYDLTLAHRMFAEFFTTYVIHCNRVGYEDGIAFGGYSGVTAPDGAELARGPHFDEALITARIDPAAIRWKRRSLPLLRDEKPDLVLRELQRIVAERDR